MEIGKVWNENFLIPLSFGCILLIGQSNDGNKIRCRKNRCHLAVEYFNNIRKTLMVQLVECIRGNISIELINSNVEAFSFLEFLISSHWRFHSYNAHAKVAIILFFFLVLIMISVNGIEIIVCAIAQQSN